MKLSRSILLYLVLCTNRAYAFLKWYYPFPFVFENHFFGCVGALVPGWLLSVGVHFTVNITMGFNVVKGLKCKFTWQTQAVLPSLHPHLILYILREQLEQMADFVLELWSMQEMITSMLFAHVCVHIWIGRFMLRAYTTYEQWMEVRGQYSPPGVLSGLKRTCTRSEQGQIRG